jgi:hypothetical protein
VPGYRTLRASDADRDAVAERLRRAAVEGRLEPDELEERLHAALRARTYGELDRLLVDLPAGPVRRRSRGRVARPLAAVAISVIVGLIVVAAVLAVLAIAAAAWVVWLVIGLLVASGRRGCAGRRHHVRRTRPAGLL